MDGIALDVPAVGSRGIILRARMEANRETVSHGERATAAPVQKKISGSRLSIKRPTSSVRSETSSPRALRSYFFGGKSP